MKEIKFTCRLTPDNSLPAFAAYMAGEEVDDVPHFLINFSAIFQLCAEEGFNWKEEVSDCVVHELLHLVQHEFGLAFEELDIEGAIERARLMPPPPSV